MSEQVVITGMGALTCLGHDVEAFWQGLVAGRSGIEPIRKFDAAGIRNPEGGEVHGWSGAGLPEWAQDMDDSARFALGAAQQAARSAGLAPAIAGDSTGVILATNFGGAHTFQEWASTEGSADQAKFQSSLPSVATDATAVMLGASGPRATLSLACSSGAAAIGLAVDWIRQGKALRIVAGGYDALTLYCMAGLSCLRTVTTGKLQPFDKNRSGTVFGEGAGMVVVESLTSARERNAQPLAIVSGWATNNNAYHLTAPEKEGEGQLDVMRRALADAGRDGSCLGYVNAHGTGTRYNDVAETTALHSLLGARASSVPVSSIKAAISHTMGAAGALEAIATILAIRSGVLPPTLNWQERDPDCDLDYVPNEARRHPTACALTLSSGIGGNNAALVLEQYG